MDFPEVINLQVLRILKQYLEKTGKSARTWSKGEVDSIKEETFAVSWIQILLDWT